MQEGEQRPGVLAVVSALIPEREREDRQHDKQHPHSDSFARDGQAMMTKIATFLADGTRTASARFIADEIGDNATVGASCCGWRSRRRVDGGADAVSVLGRRAIRADEDVVGRVRARA